MKERKVALSVLISIGLGVAVFLVAVLTRDSEYSHVGLQIIDYLTAAIFVLFLLYLVIALVVSLIWRRNVFMNGLAGSVLIYVGLIAITFALYPEIVNSILRKWDFRFTAFGLALVSFGVAMLPRE